MMNKLICRRCGTKCSDFSERKFCDECKCRILSHYDSSVKDVLSNEFVTELCPMNNSLSKSVEEISKMAKTFGVMWLPIGIQPSEIDRFLKYFPVNSDIRKSMFAKSEIRNISIQLQIPFHDRCRNNMLYITEDMGKKRCDDFLELRKEKYANFGRLDHLDKSEGKECKECSEIISFGEMSVILPKQFQKDWLVWHPNCFKCIQCQQVLIDYIFCWDSRDDSGPYCLRHFDDRNFPRCGNCDELIFEEEYATVLDECFHIEHLRCDKCDCVLANTQFILDGDNSPACKSWKCVSCISLPKINSCFICRTILNESHNPMVNIDGYEAHKTCISCDICNEQMDISDPESYLKDGVNQLHCKNCNSIRKWGQCRHCKIDMDMNDKTNVVNGKFMWHLQCLRCSLCDKAILEGDQFTVVDNKAKISRATRPDLENASAICRDCFLSKHEDNCSVCLKRLDEEGLKFKSKLFHRSCLSCHNCLSNVDPTKFATNNDDIYCINCYSQLFCNSCFGCKTPIMGSHANSKMVNFETTYWHQECFFCFSCRKSLLEDGFLFGDDRLSCVSCDAK